MEIKKIFRRYEQKYVISEEVAQAVIREAEKHMAEDPFGETDIMNIYYDTPDNRLIRNSLEKPTLYKEKLRLRCYGVPKEDSKAFVELKKKYDSVVYKRRITLPYNEAVCALETGNMPDTQIGRELEYFLKFYGSLAPAMVITYHRRAYIEGDFRLTFDSNILYRRDRLDLRLGIFGEEVTDKVIMEMKSPTAIPFWMLEIMSRYGIRKQPFSKYGTAYTKEKLKEKQNG